MLNIFLITTLGLPIAAISASAVIGAATISNSSILYSSKSQVKGLTTSVGMLTCAIVGLTAGAGFYTVTLMAFGTLLLCLSLFPAFEMYLKNKSNLQDFVTTIRKLGLIVDDIEMNPAYLNSGLSVYSVSITINSKELKKYKKHGEIIEALRSLEYIYYIEEIM